MHKDNSTTLMATNRKTMKFIFISLSHVIRKYMLLYAEGDHATDHGEAHGKGRAE